MARDPNFITVETSDGSPMPAVKIDGVVRVLGHVPRRKLRSRPPGWLASGMPIIPRSLWKPIKYADLGVPILNQGQHGSCAGEAADGALMRARALAGMPFELLSPTYIYAFINGGRDAGAPIGDAGDVLLNHGTCTMAEWGQERIFRGRDTAGPDASAARFRAADVYTIDDKSMAFDMLVTGLMHGYFPAFPVEVGPNFYRINAAGIAGVDVGPGNHAVHADGYDVVNGKPVLDVPNSWGVDWNRGGRVYFTEGNIRGVWWDAWMVRAVGSDPQDKGRAPLVIG